MPKQENSAMAATEEVLFDGSSGPITLVSSFFPECYSSEHGSFLQLLAGGMAYPPGLGYCEFSDQEPSQVATPANNLCCCKYLPEDPPFLPKATLSSWALPSSFLHAPLLQQTAYVSHHNKHSTFEFASCSYSSNKPQSPALIIDKPADDGYNWRKYGQKQMKGETIKSYYKCTHPMCLVKKTVQCSSSGHITEITYRSQHNHQRPREDKQGDDNLGEDAFNAFTDLQVTQDSHIQTRDGTSSQELSEHLSYYGEEEVGDDDDDVIDDQKSDMGFGMIESASGRTLSRAKIIFQTASEVDLLDDGYRWRKYGQKVVKGNPNPRSYYRCTNKKCKVRKQVERDSTHLKLVLTAYNGKHNHDPPPCKSNSCGASSPAFAEDILQPKAAADDDQ